MMNMRKWTLNTLLWSWVGTVYFFMEVIWKTLRGHPEAISWTMLALAIVLSIPLERCGAEVPWEMPLWLQSVLCGTLIMVVEFIAGVVLNIWLGLGVWDYSNLWGNLFGQVCPQFWAIWVVLSAPAIVLLDWIRYIIDGGDRPKYKLY